MFSVLGNGAHVQGSADSLLTDLVAWWSMDEASGTRVNAHNPGTHDLTDNNTVGFTTGVVGNAADFVAANSESLSCADHDDLTIADVAFSVAGWAKFTSDSLSNAHIICKGRPGSAGGEWGVRRAGTLEAVLATVRNAANSASSITSNVSVTYNTFFFFILEHLPDSDTFSFEVNRGTPVTISLAGGTYDGTGVLSIGSRVSGDYVHGAADNMVIARRLWTTDEKDRLYNSGSGMAYPG